MNIVIVGFGTAGKNYFNLLKLKNRFKIFIVDKLLLPKSEKFTQISFDEIRKKKLFFDYAIIASPSGLHFKHALFFLKNGSHVLIEKPFVLRLNHAKKLISVSSKKKLKCWTSLQNRYNLAITKLKSEINSNSIGKIGLVDCSMLWHRDKKYYSNNWRGKYSSDGGVLTNQAIHLLDILIFNFGKINSFDAYAEFNENKLEAEDLIIINFRHQNGILSSFKATTRANKNYRSAIDIVGDKGRIIVKGISLNTFNKFRNNNLILIKKFSENFEENLGSIGSMGFGHKKILDEFLIKNKKSSRKLEIKENYYLLKVIHSIYNCIHKVKKINKIKDMESILGK
jgi:UDP-N-acetyl-2-amino-2-deoxyglucuronate dehydrogenase